MIAAQLYANLYGEQSREETYLQSYHRFYGHEARLYSPEFLARVATPGQRRILLRPYLSSQDATTFLNRVRLADISLKGSQNILPRMERMANAWGLDARTPLFDRALAVDSFRLPPTMKLHGACEKYVLKLILQKKLPREVVWRRKFGMSVPITDWALEAVSSEGSVRWGVEHLSYELDRRIDRWVGEHGAPPGVIKRQPAAPPPEDAEPDLGDYSFDRAVICDRARTVDLLLANNFHFENNCAVLSVGGYPKGPFEVVRAMLKRNPQLAVYALHDATPEGCRLAHTLANDPEWFAGRTVVIDVGLRPSQAAAFTGSFLPGSDRDLGDGEGVTKWEKAWLGKYRLEIAVIRPEQVVKRLFRAINQPAAQEPGPGNVVYLPRRDPEPASSTVFVGDSGGSSGEVGGTAMAAEAHDADGGFDAFG